MNSYLYLRVKGLPEESSYVLQWSIPNTETRGEVLPVVSGIACLEPDIEQLLTSLSEELLADHPPSLRGDYLSKNPQDVGVFSMRFSSSPGGIGVVVVDETERSQLGFHTPGSEKESFLILCQLVARAIAEKLDPALRARYVVENGEARINPEYIQPPVTRYFP